MDALDLMWTSDGDLSRLGAPTMELSRGRSVLGRLTRRGSHTRGTTAGRVPRSSLTGVLALMVLAVALVGGCKGRKNTKGELSAPEDAPAWEERFAVAFDDDYTGADLELRGRAPHDVLDQRLFAARLGHAAIVAIVEVEQVWGRGRYQGRRSQYIDVELGDVLFGELPKGTRPSQLLPLRSDQEIPADLHGKPLVLFLRWAPGADPEFHHHLMPADEDIVAYIRALVSHARQEGALDTGRKGKRKGKRASKRKAGKGGDAEVPSDGAPAEE